MTELMCNGWIKSWFQKGFIHSKTHFCMFCWLSGGRPGTQQYSILNGCTSIPNNLVWAGLRLIWNVAWLRTVRCEVHSQILNPLQLPLFRSEGTDETTLIKQENLDNGAWLWSDCKTDESGVFTGPGQSYKPFTGQSAATLHTLLPLWPSTGTLLKADQPDPDIW